MFVKVRADSGECSSAMRDLRPWNSNSRLLSVRVSHHCRRTLLDRGINVTITIGALASHGNEQISRSDLSRIELHSGDISIAGAGHGFHSAQDLRKLHLQSV